NVKEIFNAFGTATSDEKYFEDNYKAILDDLQTKHHFPLTDTDVKGIRFVYEYFGQYGPDLTYWMSGGFGGRGGFRNPPTYRDIATGTDAAGELRGYLATDENYKILKTLEAKNLLIPVVGNFAGPKALRAVGAWLKEKHAVVSAFYLSNVEQYLNMDGIWMD